LSVFVTNETVTTISDSFPFHIQELTQVFEQLHLIAEVLGVILDMPLMGT
jgi:hypothetical protein